MRRALLLLPVLMVASACTRSVIPYKGRTERPAVAGLQPRSDVKLHVFQTGLVTRKAKNVHAGGNGKIHMDQPAFVIDHPGAPLNYRELFPEILKALKKEFYRQRENTIRRIQEDLMRHGTDEFASLPAENQAQVEGTLRRMESDYGYCLDCSKDVILYVLKQEKLPGTPS